jgi:hypothetical protein
MRFASKIHLTNKDKMVNERSRVEGLIAVLSTQLSEINTGTSALVHNPTHQYPPCHNQIER